MARLLRSLRARVAFGIFAVALVPTLILSWLNYESTRAALRQVAEASVRTAAARAASEADAFHARALDHLRALSRIDQLQRYLLASPTEREQQRSATTRLLSSVRTTDLAFLRTVALTDLDGHLLLTDNGTSAAGRWMLGELDEIRRTHRPAVSTVTSRGDSLFIEAATPIPTEGTPRGYLILRFDAEVLEAILDAQQRSDGHRIEAWISTDSHVRVAGGSPVQPILTSAQKFSTLLRDSLAKIGEIRLEAPTVTRTRKVATPRMLPDSTAIFEVTEIYGSDSTRVLFGAAAPMHSRPWRVNAVISARDALAPARSLLRTAVMLAIALSLLAFVLASIGGRRLAAPLDDLSAQAVRIAGGDFSARVSVSDTRELGNLGRAFNDLAERVGSLVRTLGERTRELELDIQERARLEHELSDARRLEAVGRLAGGVAHDFNNLLTVVLANLSMAEDALPPGSPELAEIRAARDAAARGADLTKQLLAFSRRGVVHARVIDLAKTVQRLEPLLGGLVGETIDVTLDTGITMLPVVMDPTQIDQVVINLAANARDAMPIGGSLRIAVRRVDTTTEVLGLPPGAYAELTVSDTGEGMTPDTLARAFEPFFTTKEMGRGTGLGLATVYGIVTRADGSIHIESAPGRGTTFVVRLPLSAEVPEPDSGPSERPESYAGRGETVVLAEDNRLVRDATARLLREWGYQVIEAHDGVAALEAVARAGDAVRLVISDVLMPRLDGVALRTKLLDHYPDLPVLLMSGNPPADTTVLQRRGEFLAKPYSNADLARRVRDLLDRGQTDD